MGAFANNLSATAFKLLSTYGQLITGIRKNLEDYSELTGTVNELPSTEYTGFGYPENYTSYLIDNVLIKQQDIKLTLYSATEVPVVNDIITVSGVSYTAQNVEKVTAQGTDLIYIVQLSQ